MYKMGNILCSHNKRSQTCSLDQNHFFTKTRAFHLKITTRIPYQGCNLVFFALVTCQRVVLFHPAATGGGGEPVEVELKSRLAPPFLSASQTRNLPDPENSKSASATGDIGGGDTSVALPPPQPSSPPWCARSAVRASALRVHTTAGGATWLPQRGQPE